MRRVPMGCGESGIPRSSVRVRETRRSGRRAGGFGGARAAPPVARSRVGNDGLPREPVSPTALALRNDRACQPGRGDWASARRADARFRLVRGRSGFRDRPSGSRDWVRRLERRQFARWLAREQPPFRDTSHELDLRHLRQRHRHAGTSRGDEVAEHAVGQRQRQDDPVGPHMAPAVCEVPEQHVQAGLHARLLDDRHVQGEVARALERACDQPPCELGIASEALQPPGGPEPPDASVRARASRWCAATPRPAPATGVGDLPRQAARRRSPG